MKDEQQYSHLAGVFDVIRKDEQQYSHQLAGVFDVIRKDEQQYSHLAVALQYSLQ